MALPGECNRKTTGRGGIASQRPAYNMPVTTAYRGVGGNSQVPLKRGGDYSQWSSTQVRLPQSWDSTPVTSPLLETM